MRWRVRSASLPLDSGFISGTMRDIVQRVDQVSTLISDAERAAVALRDQAAQLAEAVSVFRLARDA